MNIDYFRPRKQGPESEMEDIVARQIGNLFDSDKDCYWAAASPSIGAGIPDLIAVSCEPQVFVLEKADMSSSEILAYLRAVGCVHKKTIIERLPMPTNTLLRCLDELVEMKTISNNRDIYSINPIWRKILPEIVSIEVKVKNWKHAIVQAARNYIFSHRAFVALPEPLAKRVRHETSFKQYGIGLLSVNDNGDVKLMRRPKHHNPLAWKYYYDIALLVAKGNRSNSIDICTANEYSCNAVS